MEIERENAKWTIYWNEYASDTYLHGSRVVFHKRNDVEFENVLMPPGTVIKRWYSKTNYQTQRIEPSLPLIDGESSYRIMIELEGEDVSEELTAKLLIRLVFFDRYEQVAGDLMIRGKAAVFRCPLKTYSYQIELINAGTTHFHFHSMVIEELPWDKQET